MNTNKFEFRIGQELADKMSSGFAARQLPPLRLTALDKITQAAMANTSILSRQLSSISAMGLNSFHQSIQEMSKQLINSYHSRFHEMSKQLVDSYNDMLKEVNLSAVRSLQPISKDLVSLNSIRFDNIMSEIEIAHEPCFDNEEITYTDLQEVEAIIDVKISNIYAESQNQTGDIVYAINQLTKEIAESNKKETLKDKVLSQVLSDLLIKVLIGLLPFIVSWTCSTTSAPVNNTQIVQTIKKEVRQANVGHVFYSSFRMVVKDELPVRRSNKMKSRIKYYLDFGSMVKIEYKNKNWTKVGYTNAYTEEMETGWVLTRYIKRLD